MRKLLDGIYDGAVWLAALAMIALLAMVLLSIVSRLLHFHVPGTDAYAGYLMAASGFLAMAHTLKRGEHIRVTLFLSKLPAGAQRAFELWSLAAAVTLTGLLAYYSGRLVWVSHQLNDISTSSDATALWLPQLAMAFGAAILLVAVVDELVLELRGERVAHVAEEASHNE